MELYPLLPIVVGLALLAWAARDLGLTRSGIRAPGEIVGYQETGRTSRMVVRFRTRDGRDILTTDAGTAWAAARTGEPVVVSYDRARPERARVVEGPWQSGGVRAMVGMLGGACLLIGALIGVFAWG
ncbi:DUF3592 domain-containing protein [Marinactinospora thermotolerans]|uniref:DUF3592 domain-containing protein n=1 Tax=Marinactinospora thermotolerans DSM 45154 TaxID=1122192 RepID=A0A1T4QHB1_9ACTN|nr:DUF3592 domain-containing protein [Marinactinospora thermotolerans]SKA03115.1 Protein of unknown function [Marinactinospora thermotolerans DSM 45154]